MVENWKKIFYTIWAGQAASLFTSAIVQYALVWYLTEQTKSATVLSVAMLVGFLPMAIFSPFIGAIVDRYNRKVIMMISDGSIALVTIVIAVIGMNGEIPVWLMMTVLFCRALGTTFHQPCLQAVTPLLVPNDQLVKCNGYTYSLQCVSLIFSPALAAVLFAAIPLPWIILLDVVGAGLGVLTVGVCPVPKLDHVEDRKLHVLKDAWEGIQVLKCHKGLFYLIFISGLFCIAYMPASSLYPLMCMDYFGGTATHAGIAETAFSIGMLLGSLAIGIKGSTKNKMVLMTISVVVLGAALAVIGFLPPEGFPAFVALTLVSGLAVPFFSTIFMTMIQEKIPPEYLGRIMSLSSSIMAMAAPIGLIFSGAFAEKIGLSVWFVISGIATLVCAGLCVCIKAVRNADK